MWWHGKSKRPLCCFSPSVLMSAVWGILWPPYYCTSLGNECIWVDTKLTKSPNLSWLETLTSTWYTASHPCCWTIALAQVDRHLVQLDLLPQPFLCTLWLCCWGPCYWLLAISKLPLSLCHKLFKMKVCMFLCTLLQYSPWIVLL